MGGERTNAERQRRYIARLKAQAARAPGAPDTGAPVDPDAALVRELAQAKARIAELTAELARLRTPAKTVAASVEWWLTPAQIKRAYRTSGQNYVLANWLRGHKGRVIEVTMCSAFGTDSIEPFEQNLAQWTGVYRIARIVGGRFGPKKDQDLRKQVRALIAVTERALQEQPLAGAWAAPGDVVVYDPRELCYHGVTNARRFRVLAR
jgi:hypothetical protein